MSINEKRDFYHNQSVIKTINEIRNKKDISKQDKDFIFWVVIEDYQCTKEEYIEREKQKAILTFAVVKDGKWYERGSMGWWGCVSDKKDRDKWNKEFNKLIESVSDDTLLTIVDCHI